MRALLYLRVSEDQRGEGRSVQEQEHELRAWADREGWTVTGVISETGSASRYARSTRGRQRWGEVTVALESRCYDALLVWEASRATRDLTAYSQLRDLCAEHGVSYGYSGTLYNLTERADRFRTGLDALLSEDESARTSDRVRRSVRARAQAGAPHGKLPYGYRREYDANTGALLRQVPDEETAPIVAEIYRRLAAREACASIARDLTERGIAPPRPGRSDRRDPNGWIGSTVRRIALSPTNIGQRVHQGVVVGAALWPPLIDEQTHTEVAALLTDPSRLTHRGTTVAHLLSGIASCGECGALLRRIKNRGTPSYQCPDCFRVACAIWKADRYVSERMVALLGTIDASMTDEDHQDPDLQQARAELDGLHSRLNAFTDQAADGGLSVAGLARVEARLLPQIRVAEMRVRALYAPSVLRGADLSDPQHLWEEVLTLDDKRRYIRGLVTVVIGPAKSRGARGYDPSRFTVTPRW